MKHPVIAGLVGLAALIAAVIYLVAAHTLPKGEGVPAAATSTEVTMIQRTASTTMYELDVSYPNDPRDREGLIAHAVESFLASEMKQWQEQGLPTDENGPPSWRYQAWVTSTESTSSVFDIRCHAVTQSEYAGGAHPNGAVATFCFDAASHPVSFDDVFADETLQYLASTTLEKTKGTEYADMVDTAMFESGYAPKKENFSAFTIQDDGIHFLFQQYQIAAYAAGYPELVWTWKELAPYLTLRFSQR